jgi:phage portal protein BeeE
MSAMGAPAVLSGGVTLTPMTITPKEMALLELRQFDEVRISTLLGVPPTLMALPSGEGSLTYNNTQNIYDFHWRAYLRPRAATIMEAISHWALPSTQSVELNRDEYVRPDFASRVTAYVAMAGIGAMTIDEIRTAERLSSLDPAQQVTDPTTNTGANPTPPAQPAVGAGPIPQAIGQGEQPSPGAPSA